MTNNSNCHVDTTSLYIPICEHKKLQKESEGYFCIKCLKRFSITEQESNIVMWKVTSNLQMGDTVK